MIYAIVFTSLICIVQAFYLFKFASTILRTEDSVEESLDIIDNSYGRISEILEKPLFYDSAEVRQILNELSNSKEALLYIANVMANNNEITEKEID